MEPALTKIQSISPDDFSNQVFRSITYTDGLATALITTVNTVTSEVTVYPITSLGIDS
jgi:hypothetical protein